MAAIPEKGDPVIEGMPIDVCAYYEVSVDVDGLHRSPELERAACELLDPGGRMGLERVMVARVRKVAASRDEAEALAASVRALGLRCEIIEREHYTPGIPGMIVERQSILSDEVARRRATGGALRRRELPETTRTLLERFDLAAGGRIEP